MLGLLASSIVVPNVQTVPALGLRFYGGDHEGFVLAATWSNHSYERSYDSPYSFDRTARMAIFTMTAGWRFRWDPGWFLEAGIGGGRVSQSGHPSLSGWNGDDSIPGPFQRRGWRPTRTGFPGSIQTSTATSAARQRIPDSRRS